MAKHEFLTTSDIETTEAARRIAPHLSAGDVILLSGDLGAGKTHFARAVIRARVGEDEPVPSPTFTLVQTYEADGVALWHCDLYRLGDASELIELGLTDAMQAGICLIEWPERLEDDTPEDALHLTLTYEGETARRMVFSWRAPRWQQILKDLF